MNSFELLLNLNFSESLSSIELELVRSNSSEEISRLLIIANIALMQEGSENVSGKRPEWMIDSLTRLEQVNPQNGNFYPVLLAFEASRLFASDDTITADSLFKRASDSSISDTSNACISFLKGIFELNHFHDLSKALDQFNQSISLFESNTVYEEFLYFKFWAHSMRAFTLIQLGEFNKSITESLLLIEEMKKSKYLPLLENCYLNLSQAYTSLGNFEKTLQYLEENLNLWDTRKNQKRIAVGLTIAAISAITFHNIEVANKYLQRRKETWIPLDIHWNMISNALIENGYSSMSEEWTWKPDLNATSA